MTGQALTLTYRSPVPKVDEYWLRIEPQTADLSVASDDAAELIDTIYQLDPCFPDQQEQTTDPADNADKVGEAAESILGTPYCDIDRTRTATARIYRSHPADEYALRGIGAELAPAVITPEQVSRLITVEDAAYVELEKPVVSGWSASWTGAVKVGGKQIAAPEIKRLGNLVYWNKQVTGMLSVSYRSTYDLVTLTYPDQDDGGDPPGATLLAFYHGAATMESVSADPLDSLSTGDQYAACRHQSGTDHLNRGGQNCYEVLKYYDVCSCSGDSKYNHTEERGVPCPESLKNSPGRHLMGTRNVNNYSGCGEPDECHKSETYEQLCCHAPPKDFVLPDCCDMKSNFGGVGLDPEVERQLKAGYPERSYNLSIIPVGPPSGEHCGTTTVTQRKQAGNCCDGVPPLTPPDDDYVVGDNSDILIHVEGGMTDLPLTWTVTAPGAYLDARRGARRITTTGRYARLYTTDVCGTIPVMVTDGCSSTVIEVRAEDGRWVETSGIGCVLSGTATSEYMLGGLLYREKIFGGLRQREIIEENGFSASCHPYFLYNSGGYQAIMNCMESELTRYILSTGKTAPCITGNLWQTQCGDPALCTPPPGWPVDFGIGSPTCEQFCWNGGRAGFYIGYVGDGHYRVFEELVRERRYYRWVC